MKIQGLNQFNPDEHKFNVAHVTSDAANWPYIIDLFSRYRGSRKNINYSSEHITGLLKGGRFSDGFLILEVDDEPLIFFGLGYHRGWSTINRYVALAHYKIPLTSAYLIPKWEQMSREIGRHGVFFSFNVGDSTSDTTIYRLVTSKRSENWAKYQGNVIDHPIYKAAEGVFDHYVAIPKPVWYMRHQQLIVYRSFTGAAPQFDPLPYE